MSENTDTLAARVLCALPAMTPARLRFLLRRDRPARILDAISSWRHAPHDAISSREDPLAALLAHRYRPEQGCTLGEIWKREIPISSQWTRPVGDDVRVHLHGDSDYPSVLAGDTHAPAVLFTRGDVEALNRPRVAIIGTRQATSHGRECARRFGAELCAHGVSVVSGLARGIDAHAHRGVLSALTSRHSGDAWGRPVGVVASGLDVIYPPEHGQLWEDVATHGLLMSESPPGAEPAAFRFPLRNRIIAAVCSVVVVIESRLTGGSMITVRHALERGLDVMAVPGSPATRASQGTNLLIRDGASIAVEPADVLTVLGLEAHRALAPFDARPVPTGVDAEILETIGAAPVTLTDVVEGCRRPIADVALALGRLEARGWVTCTSGWFERCGPSST